MDLSLRILVVEESETDSMLALKALHSNGYHQIYKRVDAVEDLILALKDGPWDIIIVDISRKQFDEQSVLRIIKESGIDIPCLILSERIGEERRVRTIKDGVNNNIHEDSLNEFIPSVRSEVHDALLSNMHKQAEKDFREQKEWFRVTLSSIGDAVITTDVNSIVTFVNPVAEQITGYSQAEAIGKPISHVFRIFNEINLEPAEIPVDRVIRDGFIIGLANHTGLVTKEGETRSIADSAAPIRNDDGSIIGVVMVFRDITETKRLEENMARLDKLNVVGQMAAGIAHEIRNPMSTVRGFLQLLSINKEFHDYTSYFETMVEELDRANTIISGFLTMAKDKAIEAAEANLNNIIGSIAPLIQAEAIMHNKYVKLELGEIPNVMLIENDIRQLTLNLVRNGLEASAEGDGAIIRTFAAENKVVLSVQDNGKGINKDLLEKLGTPFLTTKENGTGLGLFICYNLAEKNNASIEIDTSDNGTTFSVLFR
ncbi:MAG: kinE 4 [Firmicutes bacterium]|nr:kinE 4 [Bacillota bacterium]